MKISLIYDMIYPYVLGGAEHRNFMIAKALGSSHEVSLYGFCYWERDPSLCLASCRYVGIGAPAPAYDKKGRRRFSQALLYAARLILPLLASPEEIWDVSNIPFLSVPVARLLSMMKRRTLIVTWHEYWGEYWYEYLGWKGFMGQLVESLALRCSPRIIAVSEHTKRRLLKAGYPSDRIDVVVNGIDTEQVSRVPPAAASTDLVYAGRLIRHKRVDLVIRSLRELRRTVPQATLLIIGDGPEKKGLVQLARDLQLQDGVTFLGPLPTEEDVFSRLKSSRVLVMPSTREGFGMTVIQAWACGIPAVVCDEPHSALPDLIDDPCKGRVVPSDPSSIASACRELLSLEPASNRARLFEEARRYDLSRMMESLEAVYGIRA